MKLEIKEKWVAALRSGEYKQGKSMLRVDDSYCCLGVLCELHRQANVGYEWRRNKLSGNYSYEGEKIILNDSVIEWAELESYDPFAEEYKLSYLNDKGSTFPEIADLIEKHL